MTITICGFMKGWDVVKCRTVNLMEAMDAWGQWLPVILQTNERRRFQVGDYQVWVQR